MSCTYRFMNSSLSQLSSHRDYDILLRQQPERAKVSVPNERDKRSIEPPPILQMKWINCTAEEEKQSLQSPFYFAVVNLVREDDSDATNPLPAKEYLSGATVSSLYRLRDIDNTDGGFFIFGDLAVKKQGRFRLYFSLFELIDGMVENRKNRLSNPFTVYTAKQYPGPRESTFLSRTFSDQGVKMRVRKDHRMSINTARKGRTNGRKRKYDTIQVPMVTSSFAITTAKTSTTSKKEILSPPAYASDHVVHFGRWQSNACKKPNYSTITDANTPPPYSSITSSFPSPTMSSPTLSQSSMHHLHPYYHPPVYLPPINDHILSPPMTNSSANKHCETIEPFHRLPPLRDIIQNKHSSDTYAPPIFPIDYSFFK